MPPVIERALPAAGEPRGAWIDQLHRLWGETWVPSLSLGTRAREVAERRFALDPVQLGILEGLLENERVLVQGGAGSGKTLLAAEAARRARSGSGRRCSSSASRSRSGSGSPRGSGRTASRSRP